MFVICYYGSWSYYHLGDAKFLIEDIDPFLSSHLVYAYAGLGDDHRICSLDPWKDLEQDHHQQGYIKFNSLKSINKELKTLIAIGGWNEGSHKYSVMASTVQNRRAFVESVVEFIEKYGFDGLELDWEFPASRGGSPEDKHNYVQLLKELKEEFTPKGYLLMAAVSGSLYTIDHSYDIPAISSYLDCINVICYDYHSGENLTGHYAPLYSGRYPSEHIKVANIDSTISSWLSKGAQPEKLCVGVSTHGKTFTLMKPESYDFEAPAHQGEQGPYTRQLGQIGYNEFLEIKDKYQLTIVRNHDMKVPFAYGDKLWVAFDDQMSIKDKAQYAKDRHLAGVMVFSVDTDDFKGKSGQKYPLLKAINEVYKSSESGI